MMRRQMPTCAYCGSLLYEPTIDHVIPKSQGGGNTRDNLVLACWTCNQAKKDRNPIEWAADILAASDANLASLLR